MQRLVQILPKYRLAAHRQQQTYLHGFYTNVFPRSVSGIVYILVFHHLHRGIQWLRGWFI